RGGNHSKNRCTPGLEFIGLHRTSSDFTGLHRTLSDFVKLHRTFNRLYTRIQEWLLPRIYVKIILLY
ncbi:hypothetical protein ALC57_06522, partial [Trachymyrmex cornetzi]